jgi:hypothetical protein
MRNVTIESSRQALSLLDGTMTNELVLRLPNGHRLSALVDDAGLKAVLSAFAEQGGAAVQRAVSEPASTQPAAQWPPPSPAQDAPLAQSLAGLELDQGENTEFGGDYEGPPDTTDDQAWVAPKAAPESTGLRVSADARGNPVIQGDNVRDSRELVGGRNAELEDDGVGSV